MDGEVVKDFKTLARVKSIDELVPRPAKENQLSKGHGAKITEEHYRIIEDVLRMDGTIEEACMLAGISIPSYYNHRDKNPDFARRMDMARQYPKLIARAAVQRRIMQGDSRTALEFLKLRDKKRYNTVPGVDEEGGMSSATRVQFISIPSDEGNTTNPDTQTNTRQESVSSSSVSFGEVEKQTPWENEEQALRNIDYLTFNNE